ncbi:MAG TPA: histidine kinase N-terminal 7TM domain-containing protein [Rubrobacteraceae bacterium]|nr:histidine kinase N-terminal 7TM domain-containing protein [Rubrobacteraceae bacterium]
MCWKKRGTILDLQFTFYTLALTAGAAVAAALAFYSWRRRGSSGARELALLMAAVSVWSLCYGFEFLFTALNAKLFWASVRYAGVVTVPVAWVLFALRYTGRERWISGRNLALLAVVPAVTLALVWTNWAHHLFWLHATTDTTETFLLVEQGAWFWVFFAYSYLLVALGAFFLVSMFVRSPGLYRGQGGALLVGALAPWVGNGMYFLGFWPLPNLDPTPLAFLVSGIAVSWSLFRYRLLDIVPVARDTVIERMNDAVIVTDTRRRVVDLNPAARRLLGAQGTGTVGSPLALLAPDFDALLEGYGEADEAHKEVPFGDGAEGREYEMSLSSLRDRRGYLTGHLLVLRDVTERKLAERELLRQRADLARTNAELEHFAYLIAHDLRAPLRAINGFSQILLEDHGDTLDAGGRDYLTRVADAARHMGHIIDELLDLSSLTRAELRRETVDLSALVRGISDELRQGDPTRAVTFDIQRDLTAECDRRLLRIALANLLDNAWKFTSRQPEARIEFGTEERDGAVVYFVRDNGVGFDMAHAKKLFGAFQRLHSASEFEGAGIGLAAVERVVERHGGRVWAESDIGRGATFYFTL